MALVAAGCGGDNGGDGGNGPTSIAITAGNTQAVRYGTPVSIAPSVVVTNAAGPMEGVTVTFTVTAGGGTVSGGTQSTNAQGIATVGSWTLGPAPGVNTLRASAGSISVNINATAITGPPSAISVVAGNNQTWVQGSQVPVAPSVVVTDGQFPVPGAHVVFAATSGGGSISGAVQTTGSNGVATVGGWRLGTATTNTASATVQSTSIPAVTFTATAEPLVITAVNKVDGDNQTGFAGNFANVKAAVTVLNQFSGATEGVPVTFSVGGGAGTIYPTAVTTDISGIAALPWWRFGTGTQLVTANAGSAPQVTFTATANAVPASDYQINVIYPRSQGCRSRHPRRKRSSPRR